MYPFSIASLHHVQGNVLFAMCSLIVAHFFLGRSAPDQSTRGPVLSSRAPSAATPGRGCPVPDTREGKWGGHISPVLPNCLKKQTAEPLVRQLPIATRQIPRDL